MTPHRINNRGTLVLDRQFKGVGRVRRASGTTDPKLFKLLDGMLGTLKQAGRVDLLKAMKTGALTPLEVWAQFRVSDLDALPSSDTMKPLRVALEAWLQQAETGAHNRASRRYGIRAILKHAPSEATVADLPMALQRFGKATRRPTMFNRARAAAQAFVRDELGRSHPIYGRLLDIRPKKEAKRAGQPLTVAELRALADGLAECGPMAWAMALTGMGPGEYWGRWSVKADRVHIHGTKRGGRVRDVPLVAAVAIPRTSAQVFRDRLKDQTDGQRTPYDFRRTFAVWMEVAGIPRTRRRMYLGHGVKDVTDLYERHDIERYLREDGERLRCVVGDAPPAAGLKLA